MLQLHSTQLSSMSSEEFTKITYKRKSKRPPTQITTELAGLSLTEEVFDQTKAIRRVLEAKDDILASDYYSNVQAAVNEALSLLHLTRTKKAVKELICFGIGHIAECMISRYQFALILLLKDAYGIGSVKISDPVLTQNDSKLLEHFAIEVIAENIEAKYRADDYTLFYLPHCPKQLSNNLLWANWSLKLENCIIVANSFQSLLDNNTKRELIANAEYVLKISGCVMEVAIFNTFKYFEMFNDAAVHVFTNLGLVDAHFWSEHAEPHYCKDLEYISVDTVDSVDNKE